MTEALPKHVAIIMDGNGRWAEARGLPRAAGHKQGAEAARRVVKAAGELGISYVTLFGFSSENWRRPPAEIKELMKLLRYYLRAETAELHRNNVRMKVIGDRSAFDSDIVELIENAESLTATNDGLTVSIALNYGGRADIMQAAKRAAEVAMDAGHLDDFEADFEESLLTGDVPDPDLLIRTSGEQRISNFLLWQCAYAEFVFADTLWPDFDKGHLAAALDAYGQRDRRFGAIDSRSEG